MTTKSYTTQEEQIARFAKAMGHPARMAILRFLASQESCFFGDIHEVLPIAKATVSQHLKELKEAGLIQGEIEAPKVRYCINRAMWATASGLFSGFFAEHDADDRAVDGSPSGSSGNTSTNTRDGKSNGKCCG